MVDVAVLISGSGTNLQALIDACADGDFPARIALVISNNPGVKGLERAEAAGIATKVINHRDFESREAFDEKLHEALKESGVKLICLAGFMRILDARFVNRWRNRMLNIHPSLLPSFKGLHTQERALEAGVRFTGCTVHFVNPELDDGPIIAQAVIAIGADDDADTLSAKVLEKEHIIYPQALKLVAEGRIRVVGNKVTIKDADFASGSIVNPLP
jgi:phosphoribosylglycinamide formyltransferase 1|tara:strand:- start:55457 stop:56101 length:645 start_codon:yes stop_codon:yes gene_type:complete